MSLVWQCDRCRSLSEMGDGGVERLPEGWVERTLPVRYSEGARSNGEAVLCDTCDDSLYEWLVRREDS